MCIYYGDWFTQFTAGGMTITTTNCTKINLFDANSLFDAQASWLGNNGFTITCNFVTQVTGAGASFTMTNSATATGNGFADFFVIQIPDGLT